MNLGKTDLKDNQLEESVESGASQEIDKEVFDAAGYGIAIAHANGTITFWNKSAEEMLGYTQEEVIGYSTDILVPRDGINERELFFKSVLRGKVFKNLALERLHKNGDKVAVSLSISPLGGKGGNHTDRVCEIFKNMSGKVEIQRLIQSEKLASVGQMSAGIAHQIGSPLGAISGRAQILLKAHSNGDDPFLKEQLTKIVEDANRISCIVHNLLGLCRKTDMVKKYVDTKLVLDKALELVEYQLVAKKIEVQLDFNGEFPHIFGLPHHLEQLFLNIISNAIDAMNEGGQLKISASCRPISSVLSDNFPQTTFTINSLYSSDKALEISFQDTGCGISEEEIEKIFAPFYTTKESGKGTGLGLAVAKAIVDFHEGKIKVDSEIGKGSTFTIILPCNSGCISIPEPDEF